MTLAATTVTGTMDRVPEDPGERLSVRALRRIFSQEDLNFLVTNRIPRKYATLLLGWFSGIESPALTRLSIATWQLFAGDLGLHEAKLTRFKSLIDEAIEFNAPLAMITSQKDVPPAERAAAVARLTEDIQELCDYAAAKSTKRLLHITLENFDREVEKKRLIGPTQEAVALADAVDRANFGLTIDLSHLPLLGESSADALATAARTRAHAPLAGWQRNALTRYDPAFPYP